MAAIGAAVPGVVVGLVIGAILGWPAGLVALGAVTVAGALGIWRESTRAVLRLLGAVRCKEEDQPRLFNVTAGLCTTFGLRMPDMYLIDDPVPNACSLGRSAHEAALVVTSGLLETLDLIELEGLVAHELVHAKRHETVLAGVAATVLLPYARLTRHDGLLRRILGDGREYRADHVAAATVRYPPGLRDGLAALARGPVPAPSSVFAEPRLAATRWLWANPGPSGGSDLNGSMDMIDVRVAALSEW